MLDRKTIEKLDGREGYRVERVAWPEDDSRTVTIYLKPSARSMYCEHCDTPKPWVACSAGETITFMNPSPPVESAIDRRGRRPRAR